MDATLGSTRLAARSGDLQARHRTDEGVGDVGANLLADILSIDDGSRTGEGALGLLTESHDHHLVKLLII